MVATSGAIPPSGASFWGQGGNVIWFTYDKGDHWWTLWFANSVDEVRRNKGQLEAVVLGNPVKGGMQRFLYVSRDSGRTWNLQSQLSNLTN